jgi:hypothetical protein
MVGVVVGVIEFVLLVSRLAVTIHILGRCCSSRVGV